MKMFQDQCCRTEQDDNELAELEMARRNVLSLEDKEGNHSYLCPLCGNKLDETYGSDPWGEPLVDLACFHCGFESEDYYIL